MLFYCEIEPLQRLFHSSGGPLQQNKDMRAFARRTLYNVLKFTGKVLQDAVSVLKRGASSNDAAAVEARRVSMSRLLTSLGDLQRYQQVYCSPNSKNWEPAQRLYQQALKLFPGSGKVRVAENCELEAVLYGFPRKMLDFDFHCALVLPLFVYLV